MTVMLLEWVITSVFLILTVLALRAAFGKRVSARLRYALWVVVLVRLLVPVQLFTSPLAGTWVFSGSSVEQNIYNVTDNGLEKGGPDDISALGGPDGPSIALSNFPLAPSVPTFPDAPEPPAAPDLTKAPVWLGWIWLGGSVVMGLVLLCSNLRFARRLRRCRIPVEGTGCPLPVYAAVGLPSPCLFGLLHPGVYVTPEAAADPVMLRHVVAHECTHFRQGDHLWSFLRCAALAAHWWNPLVWVAVKLSRRDGELACDEGVLKRLGDGERMAYGNTLLSLVTAKPGPGELLCFATTMAGDKKSLKERVSRIACAPKRILWAALAAVLVTVLACACAFGQAAEPDNPSSADTPGVGLGASDFNTDLEFFLHEDGTVSLTGSVGDFHVYQGTSWGPIPAFDIDQLGNIFIPWPPFGGPDGMVDAWWADTDRTSVTVTGQPLAMCSSGADYTGWRTFTVALDEVGGTIVETHVHGTEGNVYLFSLSDEEAITLARVAATLLTAAERFYSENHTSDQTVTASPVPDGGQRVEMAKYQSVLLGKENFSLREFSYEETWRDVGSANIADMPALFGLEGDPCVDIAGFTVLDMDGDGTDEVLVFIWGELGDESSGYLLLHQQDGKVYGAAFDRTLDGRRWFLNLKTDGTFLHRDTSGMEWMHITRLQFDGLEYHINRTASTIRANEGQFLRYIVNGQDVSHGEFLDALAEQSVKPNVEWHAFTEENINAVLG